MRLLKNESGFGIVEVLALAVCILILASTSIYVLNHNRTKPSGAVNNSSGSGGKPSTDEPRPTVGYLEIQELGIRLKLVDATNDAYYKVSEKISETEKPNIYLSTRSLDAYEGCVANETSRGVAILSTFTEGYRDEVTGDFSKEYPDAPNIDSIHYYIKGNQYDCTKGKDEKLFNSIRYAFIDSYTTIDRIPNRQH